MWSNGNRPPFAPVYVAVIRILSTAITALSAHDIAPWPKRLLAMQGVLTNHSKIYKCPPDRWLCHRPLASTIPEDHNVSASWNEYKQKLHETVSPPMSKVNIAHIVQGFIGATSAAALTERACAVCAQLVNSFLAQEAINM